MLSGSLEAAKGAGVQPPYYHQVHAEWETIDDSTWIQHCTTQDHEPRMRNSFDYIVRRYTIGGNVPQPLHSITDRLIHIMQFLIDHNAPKEIMLAALESIIAPKIMPCSLTMPSKP